MNMDQIIGTTTTVMTQVGLKILGAILLWMAGRKLIGIGLKLLTRALDRNQFDVTVSRYIEGSLAVLLNIALIVSILGYFGVETTTFAALLAAGGVAIGLAWGGLLANFAAGVFLMVLRPFRVGDAVTAAGVTGTVHEIGLFSTALNTPDNVMTIVGNNKVFTDTIQNYSANAYRRVDLTATIDNSVSHQLAIDLLRQRLAEIPHVMTAPAPEVDLLQLTQAGPVLCVRPYCAVAHYGQVLFDTNRMIRETFTAAGFPAPVGQIMIRGDVTPT
jgi:small conductance mechanosensitive channel